MIACKCIVSHCDDFFGGRVAKTSQEGSCTSMGDHHFVLRVDLLNVWMQSECVDMRRDVFAADLYVFYVVPNWKVNSSSLKPALPTKDTNYLLSVYFTSASNSVVPTVIRIFALDDLFIFQIEYNTMNGIDRQKSMKSIGPLINLRFIRSPN